MTKIGAGQTVSGHGCQGVLHSANTVEEVFELLTRDDLDEVILLTDAASATAVVPLLPKVKGVVCRSGGPTSHLALVAREFGLDCIMSADIDDNDVEGAVVELTADGDIRRV